jgi:hypothetical protein
MSTTSGKRWRKEVRPAIAADRRLRGCPRCSRCSGTGVLLVRRHPKKARGCPTCLGTGFVEATREQMKSANFGRMYGATPATIARVLGGK